jgi:hypothetical protein
LTMRCRHGAVLALVHDVLGATSWPSATAAMVYEAF